MEIQEFDIKFNFVKKKHYVVPFLNSSHMLAFPLSVVLPLQIVPCDVITEPCVQFICVCLCLADCQWQQEAGELQERLHQPRSAFLWIL